MPKRKGNLDGNQKSVPSHMDCSSLTKLMNDDYTGMDFCAAKGIDCSNRNTRSTTPRST
ncbi:hypothetical protein BDV10DRAFT_177178 [Aspergillus recurvatus]